MNKKKIADLVFMITGTFILVTISVIMLANFFKDGKLFEKPVIAAVEVTPPAPAPAQIENEDVYVQPDIKKTLIYNRPYVTPKPATSTPNAGTPSQSPYIDYGESIPPGLSNGKEVTPSPSPAVSGVPGATLKPGASPGTGSATPSPAVSPGTLQPGATPAVPSQPAGATPAATQPGAAPSGTPQQSAPPASVTPAPTAANTPAVTATLPPSAKPPAGTEPAVKDGTQAPANQSGSPGTKPSGNTGN